MTFVPVATLEEVLAIALPEASTSVADAPAADRRGRHQTAATSRGAGAAPIATAM